LDIIAPIRSRAAEEGDIQIPLWSVPLVLVVLYVCLFSGLGAIGLVGPDEPRYAAIARAMAETHDWVTPRLWGTPWFEKPVLYYWAAGAAMRLFGVSEFSARLPSALAALLAVFAATWTALRSYGLGPAWYTLLMLPTSVAMIGFARAAGPDMLFAGFLTAAMAVAVEMLQTPRPGNLARVLFGFFLGAAVLAKGPAAIVLAGGATLLWAAFSRQWRAAFQLLHPVVIAAFFVTALPWYILCALRNPDFLRVFLWQHNFERYLTPIFEHRQPLWFYAPIAFVGILPWVSMLCTLPALMRHWRHLLDSPGMYCGCWVAFPMLFFSFSQSKLPGYIIPAIPPLFVVLAHGVARSVKLGGKGARNLFFGTGALLLLPAMFLYVEIRGNGGLRGLPELNLTITVFIVVLGGLLAVLCTTANRPRAAFVIIVLLVSIIVEVINFRTLPELDPKISARTLAQQLLRLDPSSENVAVHSVARDWHYGLNYYLGRELPEWSSNSPQPVWLFGGVGTGATFQMRYQIPLTQLSKGNYSFVDLYRVAHEGKNAPPR
jgi:4-amino-4-deoxy-L-arabinose transferase-like glycosyltransferase